MPSPNATKSRDEDGSEPSAESVTPPQNGHRLFGNVSSHLRGEQPTYDSDAAYAAAHPNSSPDRSDSSPDGSDPSGGFPSHTSRRTPYAEREYDFDRSPRRRYHRDDHDSDDDSEDNDDKSSRKF